MSRQVLICRKGRLQRHRASGTKSALLVFLLTTLSVAVGCDDGPTGPGGDPPDSIEPETGSWVTYSPYKWDHDGHPFRSTYCDVFSDGAPENVKRTAGLFADAMFVDITDFFNFDDYGSFRYPPPFDKIDVYINRYHEERFAAAYWGSVFLTVLTPELDTNRFRYLFRHELTHAFEYLIEGTPELNTDVWFREGIAIHVGGGLGRVNDVSDLEAWIDRNTGFPNGGNPISIHQWEDFPEGADVTGYYTVFDAVMRYILDGRGLDKTPQDILAIFRNVRDGESFAGAFRRIQGVELVTFEREIFERLRVYLDDEDLPRGTAPQF